MSKPNELGLPHDEWQPYQSTGVNELVRAYEEGRTLFLIAPTGAGKTAMALGAARTLHTTGLFVVGTKELQRQYERLYGCFPCYGRANFNCIETSESAVWCASCEGVDCEYSTQKKAAMGAQEAVINYAVYAWMQGFPQDFVVFDEGDIAATTIMSSMTIEQPGLLNWQMMESAIEKHGNPNQINMFKRARRQEWELKHVPGSRPKTVLRPTTFQRTGEISAVMSATMVPALVAEELKIREYKVVELPSSINSERRPVYIRPLAKVGRKLDEEGWEKFFQGVDKTIQECFHYGQGIIHSVSYDLAERTLGQSQFAAFMTKDIASFRAGDFPILISPTVGRGVDFADEQARWQVILKVPFGDLSDPDVKREASENRKVYELRAYQSVMQMVGRVTRHMEDWGVTVIVDANFNWLHSRHKEEAPHWFREAVKWIAK